MRCSASSLFKVGVSSKDNGVRLEMLRAGCYSPSEGWTYLGERSKLTLVRAVTVSVARQSVADVAKQLPIAHFANMLFQV